MLSPELAAELKLKAEFRIEVASPNGVRLLPGLRLNTLHIGQQALPESELILDDLAEARNFAPSISGVLGLNAVAGFNFMLLPPSGRLVLNATRPAGEVVPLRRIDAGITIAARMGREVLTLLLDSGANHVVLFRTPEAMAKTESIPARLSTLDSVRRIVPTCWTADMFLNERLRLGTMPAAIVPQRDAPVDGLLPASVFKAVYVDQTRGELVLVH